MEEVPDSASLTRALAAQVDRRAEDPGFQSELVAASGRFINGWHDRCQPFVWTKTADQLLCHSRRQKTSFIRH